MRHPELPVVSFLCVFILLACLPAHIKSGSIPTLTLIAWMSVVNLSRGVNSLAWAGNVDVKLEVWCDITTKLNIGYIFGVSAAVLCILRHLEHVASTRQAQTMAADKHQRQMFEIFMCLGLPIIFMALHYIVQGHRFDVFEDIGCTPTIYFSVPSLCFISIPPVIMSFASFVYAALSLRHFLRHRNEFARHLRSHSAITPGRYFRLMALAVSVMIWDTGVTAYVIHYEYFIAVPSLQPWISWASVHLGFSRIKLFPWRFVPQYIKPHIFFQWWTFPITSFMFFAFFGFGQEAMSNYRAFFTWFRHTILRQNVRKLPSHGVAVLPSYHQHSPGVNVTFPRVSDNMSEAKAWDTLSLEMPEGMEPLETSSTGVFKEPLSPSPTERSMPLAVSEYTSNKDLPLTPPLSSGNHSHPNLYETVPALMITKPSNAALRDDISPASGPRPTFRRTMSPDFGITVSPVYFPEAGSASRSHEEASLARDLQGAAPISDTSRRGIQRKTETSVV